MFAIGFFIDEHSMQEYCKQADLIDFVCFE
jgi:hypothetical protein